ncbi:MAG: PKD domain-containing protein [Bacteroidales bacterium]|nr:PKD domain-containing protein [Bacteroidales bacterium]
MKRFTKIWILIWLLASHGVYAQTYNMSNTPVTVQTGQTIHFYDPGGTNNYSNSSNYTQTFSAAQSSQCLQVSFSSFSLESSSTCSFDYLEIYDGNSVNGIFLGKYCGTNSPGLITSTTGALTFIFHSDGSVNNTGWVAEISCVECGSIPSSINMTNTPITIPCGEEIQFFDPGGPNSDYASSTNITQTFTPSESGQCLQIEFTSFNTESTFDKLMVYDGNSTSVHVIGTYSGSLNPFSVSSNHGALTLKFQSDGSIQKSGWVATIRCVDCDEGGGSTPITTDGSPCSPDGIHPFCTDENPYGITYPSGTGQTSGAAFLGSTSVSCLSSTPRPAWYYMQISSPGDLLIYIEQHNLNGQGIDVDFICWGPFSAANQTDFVNKLCDGDYTLDRTYQSSHRPSNGDHSSSLGGYPIGNIVDCSYSSQATEWCFIPNAQTGQWYLLLITNYNGSAGTISFSPVGESSSASTNCSLLAPFTSNEPLCEGDTLVLTCENPTEGASYYWSGPNGWSATTQEPSIEIPNCTTSMSGEYSLYITAAEGTSDTSSIDVNIYAIPEVSLSSTKDTICKGESVTLQASGATSYTWQPTASTQATRTLSPSATTTYIVTGSSNGCSSSDSLTVVVHPKPTITISTDPETAVVCQGDTAILHASGANSYQWRKTTDTTTLSHSDSLCVAPTNNSSYRVIGTSEYGCTNSATKNISIRTRPTPSISGADYVCIGDSILLSCSNASSFLWNTGETSRNIRISPTEDTDYEVTVTNSYGCTGTATKHIEAYPTTSTILYDTACNSYTWHDNSYFESGTYLYQQSNEAGCQSTDTLYLIINRTIETSEEITACHSFTWIDSITYTQSTSEPSVTMTSIDGCDSIIRLHLTIYPIEESTETVNACDSFTWIDGQTYYANTTEPSITLNSIHGCDSVVHLHLNLYHSVEVIDSIVACDNYTWIDGQTYTQSTEDPTATFSTTHGCDSIRKLHLTILHSSSSIENVEVCDSYTWIDGQTYTQSTNEPLYTLTNAAGCDSIVHLHLSVHHSVENTETVTACDSFTWIDGQTYTQSTNEPTVTMTTINGCDSIVHLHLTIFHPQHNHENIIVCEPYTWHGTTYTQSGEYLYEHQDSHGCNQVDTLHLRVTTAPELALNLIHDASCNLDNGEIKLQTTGGIEPYTYIYMPEGTPAHFDHLAPGSYHLQVIDSIGCAGETQFNIENIVHQVNLIATEPAHCGQADGSVSIIATGGFGQFLYQWPAPIVSNTNEAEAVPAGQYTVSVIDSNGCHIDLPFSIGNEPGPRACFYFTHINDYTMEVINCTQNIASWHWNFGDGENSDEWQPTHSYAQAGRYEVSLTVTDDFNCENTSSEIYVINEVPTLYLPSAFIPESDIAENRVFKPIGNSIGTEHYEMIIFDRSGGVVFVSHHPDLGWDGKINKKLAPQGTYGYQIQYQTIDGIPASAHGSVILLR